jgi:hypothetical protein
MIRADVHNFGLDAPLHIRKIPQQKTNQAVKTTPHIIDQGKESHFGTEYRKTPLPADKKGLRFVCIVFEDSPHSSNEDHMKLDLLISLSV